MGQTGVVLDNRMLRTREYALLACFSLVLFGYAMIGGRPLTMHEAVLPQSACEMLADGDWIIPKSGGRPWLERPPLPQWITVATAKALGTCAKEWVVRLPNILIATGVVILFARMAASWFGPTVGLLSGLLLATMFEFTRYAWLAEADIYLCGIVTATIGVFVHLEFLQPSTSNAPQRFFGGRPILVWLFFILLGMTNLAKGLLFGSIMVLSPIVGFLASNRTWTRLSRYVWFWGWLAFVVIGGAWPLAAWLRYPDVIELWWFDFGGRWSGGYSAINQPSWYYPITLAWATQPWTVPALIGLAITRKHAFAQPNSPERFLWCWLFLPVVVFSLASGKHHHYLLQCLAPWAILGALGLLWLGDRILTAPVWRQAIALGLCILGPLGGLTLWQLRSLVPGPDWMSLVLVAGWLAVAGTLSAVVSLRKMRWAMAILLTFIAGLYVWGYSHLFVKNDRTHADTVFFDEVRARVSGEVPLVVNADLNSMDVFRILFYLHNLGSQVIPIHNLTYLADERIQDETVYLISPLKDLPSLTRYGMADVILQSGYTRREASPQDRFTLFRLRFHKHLPRHPSPSRISPMQAMARERGPFLGKCSDAASSKSDITVDGR